MIKIIYNNMILDINKNERYVKYIPEVNRFISTSKDFANGVLGSDNNTVYHLAGTYNNFIINTKTVRVEVISEEEYEEIASKMIIQKTEESNLKVEVEELKQMVNQQNFLIQQLLEKLS